MATNLIADLRVVDDSGRPVWVKSVDGGKIITVNHVWNPDNMAYEKMTQPSIKTDTLTVSGEVGVIDDDPTAKYKITDIDPTDGNSYYGYTDMDGGWYIKHVTAIEVRYVRGDSGYAAAWVLRDDPGTHYDYFYEVFS